MISFSTSAAAFTRSEALVVFSDWAEVVELEVEVCAG
jgi:hypothetical protein